MAKPRAPTAGTDSWKGPSAKRGVLTGSGHSFPMGRGAPIESEPVLPSRRRPWRSEPLGHVNAICPGRQIPVQERAEDVGLAGYDQTIGQIPAPRRNLPVIVGRPHSNAGVDLPHSPSESIRVKKGVLVVLKIIGAGVLILGIDETFPILPDRMGIGRVDGI